MVAPVIAAVGEIDHIRPTGTDLNERVRGDLLGLGFSKAENRALARAFVELDVRQRILQHDDLGPTHLIQPRRRHASAHARIVDQHDARLERADITVGGLHQLTAGCGDRTRQMASLVLLRAAHVEQIKRALVTFAEPARERAMIDGSDAKALADIRSGGARLAQPLG